MNIRLAEDHRSFPAFHYLNNGWVKNNGIEVVQSLNPLGGVRIHGITSYNLLSRGYMSISYYNMDRLVTEWLLRRSEYVPSDIQQT